jgi:hypothetical protein
MDMDGPAHVCLHGAGDWRACKDCLDEVEVKLMIAKRYLNEIANAKFNEHGDCVKPVSEPVQGRSYQQIASTGLAAVS